MNVLRYSHTDTGSDVKGKCLHATTAKTGGGEESGGFQLSRRNTVY